MATTQGRRNPDDGHPAGRAVGLSLAPLVGDDGDVQGLGRSAQKRAMPTTSAMLADEEGAASSGMDRMAEGVIKKKLADKGFGFIDVGGGKDLFFHNSAVEGARFEDLREGQRVSFTEGQGPKGPRAEKVTPI